MDKIWDAVRLLARKVLPGWDITGTYHISRPNVWPQDASVDFGGGLKGVRRSGTITAAAGIDHTQTITSLHGVVIGSGVVWAPGTDNSELYTLGSRKNGMVCAVLRSGAASTELMTYSAVARVSAPYEVWILVRDR